MQNLQYPEWELEEEGSNDVKVCDSKG